MAFNPVPNQAKDLAAIETCLRQALNAARKRFDRATMSPDYRAALDDLERALKNR